MYQATYLDSGYDFADTAVPVAFHSWMSAAQEGLPDPDPPSPTEQPVLRYRPNAFFPSLSHLASVSQENRRRLGHSGCEGDSFLD